MTSKASVYQCCEEQHIYALEVPGQDDTNVICVECGMSWTHIAGINQPVVQRLAPETIAMVRKRVVEDGQNP